MPILTVDLKNPVNDKPLEDTLTIKTLQSFASSGDFVYPPVIENYLIKGTLDIEIPTTGQTLFATIGETSVSFVMPDHDVSLAELLRGE